MTYMAVASETFLKLLIIIPISSHILCQNNVTQNISMVYKTSHEDDSKVYYIKSSETELQGLQSRQSDKNISAIAGDNNESSTIRANLKNKNKIKKRKHTALYAALQIAAIKGLNATIDLFERLEPEILRKGEILAIDHPASKLSQFSAPMNNGTNLNEAKAAYASLYVAKKLQESIDFDFTGLGRQNGPRMKISLRKTPLEALCPPRDAPICVSATKRYRTHDGTCNNGRKPRWGSAQMPFHRFLHPEYADGLETIRMSVDGGSLPATRFVSLVVHGYREDESQVTMMLLQWGQLIDHDLTATLQPRSINGSIPRCCESESVHPSCLPMTVPRDDPFLAPLGVRCLEFLRSAPAQRRDCFLSWREQTNQVTSFLDASAVYSSNPRTADTARILRDGLLLFGRGPPREDICLHGGFGHQCIRAGDSRAGEQPGLLALHTVFVAEHNRITLELSDLNPHWSDEKLYQETRRIIGAIFQHITYREFLPLVLGREVCRLFDLELKTSGFFDAYDPKVNPTVANAFSSAAFRFGHAMVQGSILRSDVNYRFINNNVTLHEENSHGDIGDNGSLHRIIRGLTTQRTLRRDEFISPELTNHLFQSGPFPFGMDLAAINIQRGRDHGLPGYTAWREPCGLSSINSWDDLETVAGPNSANRMRRAYASVHDIDLFVGGISERPVRGGLVGPTFACIIAQQFSNLRKGDRFWYENSGFESSFTHAQLNSLRQVTLSQILCRTLGNGNVLQPHSFLPHDFPGNERIRCESGIMSPINLSPWIERDPFNKEGNFDSNNVLDPQLDFFVNENKKRPVSTTLNPLLNFEHLNDVTFSAGKPQSSSQSNRPIVSNNVDFSQVSITQKPIMTRKPLTTVNNKVDFSELLLTSTTKRKRKTTATTKRPLTTVIDNKIDFTATTKTLTSKRPTNSPFSKATKKNSTTVVRRSTDKKKKKNPEEKMQHRSDSIDMPEDETIVDVTEIRQKTFRNEDNATKYLDNKAVTTTLQTDNEHETEQIEGRINHNYYSDKGAIKQHDSYYNYDSENYRPDTNLYNFQRPNNNYYPLYPPLTQPLQTTSKRPSSYQNNRPTYDKNYNRPRPDEKPISPISNKLSTPFSYDTSFYGPTNGPTFSSMVPNVNYDNMAIPLYVSPNRYSNKRPTVQYYSNRPTYGTTKKADISTFLIVETTRRTSPAPSHYFINVDRTTRRPYYDSNKDFSISSSNLLHSLYPIIPAINYYSPSINYRDHSNLTYLTSTTNKKITEPPTQMFLSSQSDYNPFIYPQSHEQDLDKFDGYLRPETSFYPPLLTNNKFNKISYNDYTKYNNKPETSTIHTVKYFFKKNVLHKYHTIKSGEPKEGLYDKDEDSEPTKRYAELYDEHLTSNDEKDNFVRLTRLNRANIDSSDDIMTRNFDDKRHNNFGNTLFVPFKLLTRIERPDNWVNVNVADDDLTELKLPDIPVIEDQDENFARELPKPINARLYGG